MSDLQAFFGAGGVVPALAVAVASFLLGAALLGLGGLLRAVGEIAVNSRVIAYRSREGSNYPVLRVVGFLATLGSLVILLAGAVGVVVLLMRGG